VSGGPLGRFPTEYSLVFRTVKTSGNAGPSPWHRGDDDEMIPRDVGAPRDGRRPHTVCDRRRVHGGGQGRRRSQPWLRMARRSDRVEGMDSPARTGGLDSTGSPIDGGVCRGRRGSRLTERASQHEVAADHFLLAGHEHERIPFASEKSAWPRPRISSNRTRTLSGWTGLAGCSVWAGRNWRRELPRAASAAMEAAEAVASANPGSEWIDNPSGSKGWTVIRSTVECVGAAEKPPSDLLIPTPE